MSLKGKGEIDVSEHEPTGGVEITRKTPELNYTDQQKLILPPGDIDYVLNQLAKQTNNCVIDCDIAEALDTLLEVGDAE